MACIDFSIANSYGVTTEEFKNYDKSLFKNAYKEALVCLKLIVEKGHTPSREADVRCNNYSYAEKRDEIWDESRIISDKLNAIIAFVGDRGTGKSTAMVSFVKFLVTGDLEIPKSSKKEPNYYFFTLPVIDPSRLSEDETIIGAIVSKYFLMLRNVFLKVLVLVQKLLMRILSAKL